MLRAVEKLVESAATHAGALDDARHRRRPLGKYLGRCQQQPLAMLRVPFRTAQGAVVGASTWGWELNRATH